MEPEYLPSKLVSPTLRQVRNIANLAASLKQLLVTRICELHMLSSVDMYRVVDSVNSCCEIAAPVSQ